jgi:hypothetical protein
MYNQDVLDLYPRANVGAKVTVTWNRFDGGAATSSTGGGGGFFSSIFGSDEPPPEKPRPRPGRAKSVSSS